MRRLVPALALLSLGCAHQSSFTSPDELKRLSQLPAAAKMFADPAIDVPSFELTGPVGVRAHETQTPWGRLLAETGAVAHFEADGALGCAARELARFGLQHQGTPSQSLSAFILGRCGAALEHSASHSLSGDVADTVSDQQLFDQWRPQLTQMISRVELGDLAGLALVRGGGKAWVVLTRQKPLARLKESSWSVDANGIVTVEGVLEVRADRVEAMINQGAIGWANCVSDGVTHLPAFRFACKSLGTDAQAWLSVGAWEPNRILGREVARLLVSPSGKLGNVYQRPESARPAAPTAEGLVERLNEVRVASGLRPLTLTRPESATAAAMVPHFFGNADAATRDKIALGLMAGWDIQELITNGNFHGGWAPQPDAGALLSDLLEAPGGRRNLLDPKATLIAVGLRSEEGTLAALLSTYEVLPPVDPTEIQKQLVVALNAARAKGGKGPVQWVTNPSDFYVREAKALLANQVSATDAADDMMSETVSFTHRPVSSQVQTVTSFDQIVWPEDVLNHPAPQTLFFVGLQRATGEAWAHYVVVVVLLHGDAAGTRA